ncbi:MAG: helix-turn-helix domain-containing protein [Kosmotogaceae bacterium]
MNSENKLKFTSSTAYDLLFSLARINCHELFNKTYTYPKYEGKLHPDNELELWVKEQRQNIPDWIKTLINRFFNCETFFGASSMIYIENNELKSAREFIDFMKKIPSKDILKYFLYSGFGAEMDEKDPTSLDKLVNRLTSDEKETLIFITEKTIHSASEKANLLDFFDDPEQMKEDYISLLEWFYENVFADIEDEVREKNNEKLDELKGRVPMDVKTAVEKLSLSSTEKIKNEAVYLGVSYYLGIMAASATLQLDKKGYAFVIGYDRMEFLDIEESETESCAEIFEALGHPERIRILRELFKGKTTVTKLAKKLKLTTREVHVHINHLTRSGLVKSELEDDMKHSLYCDKEIIRNKANHALERLLTDEQ